MQKIDLDSMSIDELATLLDQATEKLADKVAARQRELVAEMDKLAAFGKKAKVGTPKKDIKEVSKPQDVRTPEAPKVQATRAA